MGDALAQLAEEDNISRDSIFIQTKFTPLDGQGSNVPYDRDAPIREQVAQSFAVSQKNLKTPVVDSLVLHSPIRPFEKTLEAWRAMEAIFKSGGARQLGISNCYELDFLAELVQRAEVPPSVLQNRFRRETDYDVELRKFCREHGILYQSFWTLTANPRVLSSDAVTSASKRLGFTPEQTFFHYLTHFEDGFQPLTGTKSEEHMRQDLDAVNAEALLTEAEALEIHGLLVPSGGKKEKQPKVVFENQADQNVRIFWVSNARENLVEKDVAPGSSASIDSFEGHVFHVRAGAGEEGAEGAILHRYTVTSGPFQQVVIRGTEL